MVSRREKKKSLREEREVALEESNQRAERRNHELNEARNVFIFISFVLGVQCKSGC